MTAFDYCRFRRRPLVGITLLAVALASCAPREASAPARESVTKGGPVVSAAARFTVAAFNMNWGNVDLADTVAVIRRSKADLVCMQETNPVSERAIRRGLAREFPHMHFTGNVRYSSGFAMLSKSPITNVTWLAPKHGYFGTLLADVELAGRKVRVASLHLEPVVPRNGEGLGRLVGVFLKTAALHLKEIARIHAALPEERPVILVGDFNSASFGAAPRFLKERGFVDSFASVTKDADRHVTWHWNHDGTDWRFRIDYVFHVEQMRTVESRILDAPSSDHKMVVSVLEWVPAAENAGEVHAADE